ncbi:choice-of-anchor X domain-containing protein [Vibrio aphrogenes]|uniref:choice-of-anchor X domain-containing protein n=1 Tax=Vibrio aphrogenes TaxID=1891186 RepID=UPI000B34AE48|nr:choice-of-anchor X domain-containing protein [Vibrio aphrogenes]
MKYYGNILKVFVLSIAFCFSSHLLARDTVPLFSGKELFEIIDEPFKSGDHQTIVEFEVNRGQSFFSTLVIPITNAHFELIDSDGNMVIDSHSKLVSITHGEEIEPGLPGASYKLPLMDVGSKTGIWKFIIQYDEINYDSAIALQVFRKSVLNAKVAILSHLAVVGDLMVPAVLVTANGEPVLDATVPIVVTYPDGTRETLTGYDDGLGLDAVAGDGVYTAPDNIPYQQVGEHIIESKVIAHHLGYQYKTYAGKNIVATEQMAKVNNTQLSFSEGGCVNELILKANVTIKKAGEYSFYSSLNKIQKRFFGVRAIKVFTLPEGEHEIELAFSKQKLINTFSNSDILSFSPLLIEITDTSKSGTREFNSVVNPRVAINESFSLRDINFCRDDIEITPDLSTSEVWSEDQFYIKSLEFSFPVYVKQAGAYTTSLTILSANFETIDTLNFTRELSEGDNTISFSVPGEKLRKSDGPYIIRSVLFYGNGMGKNKMLRQLGKSKAYKKEVFIPAVKINRKADLIGIKSGGGDEKWSGVCWWLCSYTRVCSL